jgi:4a-hydroxytetrahydrobiopterin dehydratase
MSGTITPTRFHEVDWRVFAYAACTRFRAGSLSEGLKLARAIAELAKGSSQRPDIDLRSNGVTVRLKIKPGTGSMRR